ncbi:MAG TPA: PEP-CTERM sorting domain-containing protein [Bryobacteraceae bacterium]|nr:PEP-CTERM sorting domain-containing protein [Bryobacteraceae bacterium]
MVKSLALAILLAASVFTPALEAATVTFGDSNIYPLASYSEAGFTFQVISGPNWGLDGGGNPSMALSSGNIAANPVGATLELFLTGGGLFNFSQFDFARRVDSPVDTYDIFGLVNNGVTGSLLNFGGSSTTSFQTTSTGFGPVDRVRFVVASIGSTDLLIDNLVLNPVSEVPEPATVVLTGFVLLAGLALRRKAAHR